MPSTSSFHAQHSPVGAHCSFTVGMFGAQGGMALEQGGPAESGVFVGYKTASGKFYKLPFFKDVSNEAERFSQSDEEMRNTGTVFGEDDISRDYGWASDCFRAPGIDFRIITPFFSIPDPATASADELKFACCPATFLELTVTNDSSEEWEGFFAQHSGTPWTPLSGRGNLKGAVTRERMGHACLDDRVQEFIDFGVEQALERNHTNPNFLLPPVAGLSFVVRPGESRTVRIVLGCYISGQATFNYPAAYWYTQYFSMIDEVFDYAFRNTDRYLAEAAARDEELASSGLSADRQFLIAHATRSYYGSTEWLVAEGRPLWIVNEGEYLMINTLDLTVDMMFFELKWHPWTVRNVLEQFNERYSYIDEVFAPEDPEKRYPGGISFSHDMGVANHFSPPGSSCYECSGLDRKCFSYMTCEQLTNWILCAGMYVAKTGDKAFLQRHRDTLSQCFESLLNRDHPEADGRNGLMGFESSRTDGGGEITTYDSLDHSLGQARNNVYLGGKCWASYLTLESLFGILDEPEEAAEARAGAERCAATLENAFDEELGFIPAVLENGNRSAIIPAAEALIYPWQMDLKAALAEDGPYGGYIRMLKRHLQNIIKPGICLYDNGGWKLSSSADNSWMSKICLGQFVAHEILGLTYGGEARADAAHVQWEVEGSKFYACSDQFASGRPIGSLYYPRIVTSILWMEESGRGGQGKSAESRENTKQANALIGA